MKGDFSRLTFDPANQFTRVLMQQGRVQLDADWNEQTAILLHYLQTLAKDLIGPFGGPVLPNGDLDHGFEIGGVPDAGTTLTDLTIGAGRYYVDGILCENLTENVRYFGQRNPPLETAKDKLPEFPFLVYLDVWERHVTDLVDDHIREVALGGPDTATRAQIVWQVRVADKTPEGHDFPRNADGVKMLWPAWVKSWQPQPEDRGQLKARTRIDGDPTELCLASPEASYRGTENQLYRVEVQQQESGPTPWLTFKWSRENGSVVFPVRELQDGVATLESLGRDEAGGLKLGDWVEIVDDDFELAGKSGPLRQIKEIDPARKTVTFVSVDSGWPRLPEYNEEKEAQAKHALLRRWDHRASTPKNGLDPEGGVLYEFKNSSTVEEGWLTLEDGIQIQFQPGPYRPGDYWLIPARTATGDIEWPQKPDPVHSERMVPQGVPPHGVEHHYAPLALVTAAGPGGITTLRKPIKTLTE